jgi:hypothetical protein
MNGARCGVPGEMSGFVCFVPFVAELSGMPLAVRAADTLLLACAAAPLATRQDGALCQATLRMLLPRLAPLSAAAACAVLRFSWALLRQQGLVAVATGTATLGPRAGCWFQGAPAERAALLYAAWVHAPQPDAVLRALIPDRRGIDWLAVRRRLLHWLAQLPPGQPLDAAQSYDLLCAACGPLADSDTHGFRRVDRTPWQHRRARAVWTAALHGPLSWLGLVGEAEDCRLQIAECRLAEPAAEEWSREPGAGTHEPGDTSWRAEASAHLTSVTNRESRAHASASACDCDTRRDSGDRRSHESAASAAVHHPAAWTYPQPLVLRVPHGAVDRDMLRVLPFVRWQAADVEATTYAVTADAVAQAVTAGHAPEQLWAALAARAAAPPLGWRDGLPDTSPLRLEAALVLHGATPAQLNQALRQRSVRRAIRSRPAPGVALLDPDQAPALQRALHRQGLALDHAPNSGPAHAPATDLHPGDYASLLIASAFYRQHAPPEAPLATAPALDARLRTRLPPELATHCERALHTLGIAARPVPTPWQPAPPAAPAAAGGPPTQRAGAAAPGAGPSEQLDDRLCRRGRAGIAAHDPPVACLPTQYLLVHQRLLPTRPRRAHLSG